MVKVLGSGYANCKPMEQPSLKGVDELGVQAGAIKVTDPTKYADYGVMAAHGLGKDEKTGSSGRIPCIAEISGFAALALSTV